MKAGWVETKLADAVTLNYGKALAKDQRSPEGSVPVYGANGVMDWSDHQLTEGPSLVIGRKGSAGEITRVDGPFWPSDVTYFTSHDQNRLNFDFMHYALSMLNLPSMARGVKPGINRNDVYGLTISLPPLEEQQRIVAVLDDAFEGLARARAHAEANLQNARDLFVQELGQIFSAGKHGWKKSTIEELCTIRSGTTVPKSQEKPSGDVPYVKVADMNLIENTGGILTSSRFLKMGDVSDRKIIPAGATIFPKRGGAIMTNKKRKVLKDICADLNVMAVIPGADIDEDFLHFFFLSLDMRKIGSGSAIPQINNYDIYPLSLSYPPDLNQQAQVAETLQILRDQTIHLTESYEIKLQDLDDLRQSLLQKAFAGELT